LFNTFYNDVQQFSAMLDNPEMFNDDMFFSQEAKRFVSLPKKLDAGVMIELYID
jgi:hypothetical protein